MSFMFPKITIVTTVYNCERFIKESLDSITNQSYSDFEWIIVNDGSTDKTWEIIKTYNHPNFVLLDNEDNKRIPTRRNEAIDIAKGQYIAIHDGDDISLPLRLQKQVEYLDKHDDIFCVGGWAIQINEESEEQRLMQYPPIESIGIVKCLLHERKNPIIDPTCMFRKNAFLKLGRYSLEKAIFTVPDMDLWARAIVNGYKLANLPEPLIKYRVNSQGMTRKYQSDMLIAHRTVWQRFYREMSRSKRIIKG